MSRNKKSMIRTCLAVGLVVGLPLTVACDAEVEDTQEFETEERFGPIGPPGSFGLQPYHGRWQGAMVQVDGITANNYDATLALTPGQCKQTTNGEELTSEWDYNQAGFTCTSELSLLGTFVRPNGNHVWAFDDTSVTGPCIDGRVTLEETSDPNVMLHKWRYLDGTLDAEGLVTKSTLCSAGF